MGCGRRAREIPAIGITGHDSTADHIPGATSRTTRYPNPSLYLNPHLNLYLNPHLNLHLNPYPSLDNICLGK